ncbi:MAG: SGNH/GDSL hydrolase family protein [Acutalibacteraceae bacterium]|nr:SGNH/GDSL hydrolase family protein [Acutalibacteraceae bacterium]
MQRNIFLRVVDDKIFTADDKIGYQEEHNAARLIFDLPEPWIDPAYVYILNLMVGKKRYFSEAKKFPVTFDIPQGLMEEGNIYIQLQANQEDKFIRKTEIKRLRVKPSIHGDTQVENQLSGLIDQAINRFYNALENFQKGPITMEYLASDVKEKFMLYEETEPGETGENLYDPQKVISGKYYVQGVLTANAYVDTMPLLAVTEGDRIAASSFQMESQYSTVGGGIRVGLFQDNTWVKDLSAAEVYGKDYIEIPEGVNQIAVPYWKDDTSRTLYWYTESQTTTPPSQTPMKGTSAIEIALAAKQQVDNITASLRGKRVSVLGDSISTFAGYIPAGNRARYPQSNLLTDVDLTWWKRLLDKNGMVLGINESWAGSLVSWDGSEGTDIGADKHIASSTRIQHLGDNGQPDYILVFGGTNDVSRKVELGTFSYDDPTKLTDVQIKNLLVATFADAYRAMLIRLLKWYPKAHVICILPLYTSQTDGANLDRYNEVIKEECDFFGVPVVDTRTAGITMFNRSLYLPDGIHPNAAGMQLICNCVQRRL